MHKIQNWEGMSSWLKFFVLFLPLCTVVMLGIGVREYLSGDLDRDYFRDLFLFFLYSFATLSMFGLFVKTER